MSRLTVRIAAAVGGALVIGYIIHLQSRIASLEGRLGQSPPTAAASRPPAQPQTPRAATAPGKARTLSAEQREAMIDRLGGRGVSQPHPVWFATVANNPEAAAFQRTLQSVFEEAGWQVEGNAPIRFPMKAGIYVFAADEEPPEYVGIANEALEAGGMTVSAGRGYREFYRQKKEENPSWLGFDLGPDQTYVIAIGRQPEDAAGS